MANQLPFSCQDTNPDFRCIRVLNKLWAKVYLHGLYYFEDNKDRIPAMNFKFQKNDNLELLFKHGNVQFIKVLMSVQYYAKENLAVIVLRIHSDTYNQFKELITALREAYKKVDGEWILKASIEKTPAQVGTEIHQAMEDRLNRVATQDKTKSTASHSVYSGDSKQLNPIGKEPCLEIELAKDIIDGCLSNDSSES